MHGLEDLLNDAQRVEKDAAVNREKNNLAKEDNLKAVRDFRKDIDDYFDKLQIKVEQEIRQCHSRNEGMLTEQLKTCLEVKEKALIKQKQINSIVQKNLKCTLYARPENLRTEIATLKQTLNEASRQARCGMYEFQKNDVVQSLILTESVLGTLKDNRSGIEELTYTLPEHVERNEKLMQTQGLPSQPNRLKNKSGSLPCEMTKPITTTEVQLHKAKKPWKQRRLNSGTSRKEVEENDVVVESQGLPCQPNMQKNKPGLFPCEMNQSIRTTEVQLHKAKKPWKQRRQKSGTNTKKEEQNDGVIESRGLPSQLSIQDNKSGPSPCELTKIIRTTEVQVHKAKKPCKQGRLNSGTNKKEVEENDAVIKETQPIKSRGKSIQPGHTNKSEPPPCQTNQSIRTTEVELHKAKKPWKPRRLETADSEKEVEENDDAIEDLCKKTQIILNKLTPQNFQVLVSQMQALKIDTEDKLNGIVDLVFEKTISEPDYSEVYANMCKCLSKLKVKSDSKPGKMVIFRVVLLARCQREFKTKYRQIPVLPPNVRNSPNCKDENRKEELTYGEAEIKQRSLGNMRFIGELFKLKMISLRIMHDCVFKLLRAKDPESLACVCRLLTTIGKELDTDKDKPRMDQYFEQMTKIANDKKSSTRVRFMLQDIISVRLNKWVPRCSDNNPKTIDQIHMEVAQERQVKARLSQEVKELQKLHKGDRRDPTSGQIDGGCAGRGADGWSMEGKQPQLALVDRSKDQTQISKQNVDEEIKLGSDKTSMDRKTSSAPANRSEEDISRIIPDTCPGSRERRCRGGFWTPLNLRTRIPQEHIKEGLVNTKRGGSTLTTPSTGLPMTEIADRLHDLVVVRREDNETLFNWIESNIDDGAKANTQFIRELMTAVCQSSIKGEKGKEEVVPSDISKRRNLLQKYLGHKPMFELQALFALQVLVARLEYPQGLLKSLFHILYDEDIISEDAFVEWKRSEDEPDGKNTTLEHVVKFFEWLT
ncbi:eukaryotic translation initiation factor 4 gamma 3-like isoform X2 [Mya arenaria]|uniref:eukaryotic translation initiation factor 4 gamma 3-like isoform X2 n=1 Tax=Mya arenaria TaxID=6604 RepID=UPI0022E68C32|nr:eukaryotic translation initiation factor 4 gamma 3-like isoform X2 [Mya arenaria]